MAITQCPLLDALYCEEEQWDEVEIEEDERRESGLDFNNPPNPPLFPLFLLEQDLIGEDEELLSLFSKETETHSVSDSEISTSRREAVDWVIRVNSHYGFTALTAILAVNYFDRFVPSFQFQREKPWMIQLAAVTCLSLAAKVEETQVPLLLDLQVEGAKYVFEAKTIQRMELVVLSALGWRMNPVTPLSFVNHITLRLGFKEGSHSHWDFLRLCETLLLSLLPDGRFVGYVPSVLATSAMLRVIQQVEPRNHIDYQSRLVGVLGLPWEKVSECYQLMVEVSSTNCGNFQQNKRKFEQMSTSRSDISHAFLSSDDSCSVISPSISSSSSSETPYKKRSRASEQRLHVPSLTRVFVDVVGSPH